MTAPEPGTVARVTHINGRVMEAALFRARDSAWHGVDFAGIRDTWLNANVARVEPLRLVPPGAVVLDPGDDEVVERMARALCGDTSRPSTNVSRRTLVSLAALAAPPQPDEPKLPGALVATGNGYMMVRTAGGFWYQPASATPCSWADVCAHGPVTVHYAGIGSEGGAS